MDNNYYKKYEPIGGHWYLAEELGKGSYGTVFKVVREDFGVKYYSALKIISIPASKAEYESFKSEHSGIDDESITSYYMGFVEEFAKEYQVMELLKGHTNIVSCEDHDIRKKQDEFGWDIFIRMELLTPMPAVFKDRQPTESDCIKIAKDICTALEVCLQNNIIHRDIKPSNVFVNSCGDYKLGDFGVARTLENAAIAMSKKGTYTFMAPEVFKSEPYDHTVDIYSLGILLYRLLNDNFEPFRTDMSYGNGENALMQRMRGDPIPPPKNASERFASIILKACAADRNMRYASPSEMLADIEMLEEGTAAPAFRFNAPPAVPTGTSAAPASTAADGDPLDKTVSLAGGGAAHIPLGTPPTAYTAPSVRTGAAVGTAYTPYGATPPRRGIISTFAETVYAPKAEKQAMFIPEIPKDDGGEKVKKFCTSCGSPYYPGERFCQKCLTALPK